MSSIPAVEDFEVAASFDDRTNTIRINVSDTNMSVKPAGQPARSSSSTLCTPCRRYAAAMFISAIIAAGVWAYAKRGSSGTASDADFDIFDPSTWIPDWLDFNPHGGDSPYDFNKWNTNIAGKSACNGLELDVVDKLDDKWAPYFDQAIADWDRGDPDVLTLNVRKDSFYEEFGGCEALQGVLVVCNGDYGNTDWVGINHAVIQMDYIVSSVAKMNDYQLDKLDDAAKQWTMCHELGHGFGLGHWDENFYNRDLHNCMDYTHSPKNNQHPDRTNFLFLERMYGNVAGTSSFYDDESGTEDKGLDCSSTQSDYLEYLPQRLRRLPSQEMGLSAEEFSNIADYLADLSLSFNAKTEAGERFLKDNQHERVTVKDFPNGVQVVTTYHLA